MTQKILSWAYLLLFFLTPLIFTPLNNELFEYNKMMLVYILTVVIVGVWLIKMLLARELIVKRTPLDIPLMLFLLSQILSTIFSIDPHTSVWGYYSRSNGGLLSIISYILLFYALVSNFSSNHVSRFLKTILLAGFLVSLYAIPEHFGVSPSCIFLTGQATAGCWVQDVQARVFATLGQPNWLASYLAMLIFPALYFLLKATKKIQLIMAYLLLVSFYLAFSFTYARGATLGLLAGLLVFLLGFMLCYPERVKRVPDITEKLISFITLKMAGSKQILIIILSFILINILFGSVLTRLQLITQTPQSPKAASSFNITQLETGGTESSAIRLIVWQGAVDIFKHYPLFGSGVETFAYSYYNFRPISHNLVSEWDFLYNKAHNEYLNYLATTGLVGFLSYLAVILTFIVWSIKKLLEKNNLDSRVLTLVILASYTSYLVQNFFGFSVVIIALFFYLFPGLAFLGTDSIKPLRLPKFITRHSSLITILYKRSLYLKIIITLITLIMIGLLFTLSRYWLADTFYKKGSNYQDLGNPGRAFNYLTFAVSLNKGEPLYKSDLGYAASSAAVVLAQEDATQSSQLKDIAIAQTDKALSMSPKNVSLWRTAILTNYQLSVIDPAFEQKTVEVIDKTINLAPTDAKLYYNKALVYWQIDKKQEAVETLKKTIELKPNYREAHFTLAQYYQQLGEKNQALEQATIVLKLVPNDPDGLKLLREIQGK